MGITSGNITLEGKVSSRNIWSPSRQYLWLTLAAFIVFAAAFSLYVDAERQIGRANDMRLKSFLLADELRQSSDDLTRMVRTYVVTHDPRYKQYYQEILDIRDGKKPHPLDYYDVYWDLVLKDDRRPRDFEAPVPLLEVMRQNGFTAQEFAKLAEAKAASDALTKTEFAAMALIESAATADAASHFKAIGLLYDETYHLAKAGIMRPIGEFHEMVDRRTLVAVRAAEAKADQVRILFLVFGVLLVLSLWRLFEALNKERKAKAESEERWKYALEGAGAGVWDWDIPSGEMKFTQRWKAMLGYGEEEIGSGFEVWEQRVHPDDLETARAALKSYFDGETADCVFEHRLQCKDGGWKWILARGMVVSKGADDRPLRMIGTHTDITGRKEAELQINFMAYHDKLTGLPNRSLFFDRLSQAISQARRNGKRVALLFVDLDGFKAVNDRYGHDAGDIVLKVVAAQLLSSIRGMDTVARMGGDEFVIILGELESADDATPVARKLLESIKTTIALPEGQKCSVGASIGISVFPENGSEMDTLLAAADVAMYRSKDSGKDRYTYFKDAQTTAAADADWAQIDDLHLVGVKEIDDQHRQMAALLNGVNVAIRANADDGTVKRLFEDLADYTKFHFDSEQVLMERHSYPGIASHASAHGHLQAEVLHFRARLHKGGDLFVLQSIKDWLLDHIIVEDQPLGKFLNDHGVA